MHGDGAAEEPTNEPASGHDAPPPPPRDLTGWPVPWVQPSGRSEFAVPPRLLRALGILAFIGLIAIAWLRVDILLGRHTSGEVRASLWLWTALILLAIAFVIRLVFVKVRRRDEPILSPWVPIMAFAWLVTVSGLGLASALGEDAAEALAGRTPEPPPSQHMRITTPFVLTEMDDDTLRAFGLDSTKLAPDTKRINNQAGVRMGVLTASAVEACNPDILSSALQRFPGVKYTGQLEGVDVLTIDAGDSAVVFWCEGSVVVGTEAVTKTGAEALASAVIRAAVPAASP